MIPKACQAGDLRMGHEWVCSAQYRDIFSEYNKGMYWPTVELSLKSRSREARGPPLGYGWNLPK